MDTAYPYNGLFSRGVERLEYLYAGYFRGVSKG